MCRSPLALPFAFAMTAAASAASAQTSPFRTARDIVDASCVVADSPDHLLVASTTGVWELSRTAPPVRLAWTSPVSGTSEHFVSSMHVGKAFGERVVVLPIAKGPIRVIGRGARDEASPSSTADHVVIDLRGRIYAAGSSVIDRQDEAGTPWKRIVLPAPFLATDVVIDPDGVLYAVGGEYERGAVYVLRGDALTKLAAADKRLIHAWVSRRTLWAIDAEDTLYQIDLAARSVTEHRPSVGPLRAVTGVASEAGDLVAVSGRVAAVFDGKRFTYPSGATNDAASIAFDVEGSSLYVSGPSLRRIALTNRATAADAEDVPLAEPAHGPLVDESESKPSGRFSPLVSARVGYGTGFTPARSSATPEFDVMAGLRLGVPANGAAGFFVWPEGGYSASTGGHYVAAGAAVHYGSVLISTGPSIRGLYGEDGEQQRAGGVRSSWHVAALAGVLQLEVGHQVLWSPVGARHETRGLASVDVLGGPLLLVFIGVPLGLLSGFLITEAIR